MAETSRSRLYQILGWLNLAGIVLILFLILHKATPPAVAVDPVAATRAEQKLAAADEAKAAGQPAAPVTLDSTELNSYLARSIQTVSSAPAATSSSATAPSAPTAPSPDAAPDLNSEGASLDQVQSAVKDVKVNMDGDLVKAYVVFDFHGKDLSLELDGHLGSQNGYLKFDPVAGKLGDMPLPQSVLQSAVDKLMATPENREKLRLPSDVNDIQIANGQAVVSYK